MPIPIACACGQSHAVPEESGGTQLRCPRCARILTVPVIDLPGAPSRRRDRSRDAGARSPGLDELKDEEAKARRLRARKALVQVGKPAVKALVAALDGASLGGARTPADLLEAEARFEVLRLFHSMGPKARAKEMMLALVRLQRGDPSPAVRQAARLVRARMQEE